MIVTDIRTQVGRLIGFDSSNSTVQARMLDWINNVRRELTKKRDWKFLEKTYLLTLHADVTAGTVAITQDTSTITGTGTSFTDAMVGRYINFGGQSNWYRISKFSSTTSIELDINYIDATLSASTYVIREFYRRIPGDARTILNLVDFEVPRVLEFLPNWSFTMEHPDYTLTGVPIRFTEYGRFGREIEYTTGTVSGTANSRIVTGSGTAWVDNLVPGDKFEITGDSNDYHVNKINSDTEVELYQKLSAAVSADTTYTATSNPDSIMARTYPIVNANRIMPIAYYHRSFDFINANDEDEITRLFPELVIEGVLVWEKRAADDQTWVQDFQKWENSVMNTSRLDKKSGTWTPAQSRYTPTHEGDSRGKQRTRFDNRVL